jgi:pyruvate dehydrogenase E2 component (dihydrolipoamide acetyltransferase)
LTCPCVVPLEALVSDSGLFENDAFTPIVMLLECAILRTGRIVARPVVRDEEHKEIVILKILLLSLTFDHRVVDAGPAARLLQRCKQTIK